LSKVISVRLPNALYQQLKDYDLNIKDTVILALNRFFFFENLAFTGVNEKKNPLSYEDIVIIVDELIKARWGDINEKQV